VIIQYTQDLYRFFKLYPQRGILPDVFGDNLRFHEKQFYQWLADRSMFIEMGDFYFGRKLYLEAQDVYQKVEDYDNDPELLEKLGFIYQKMKDYSKALEFYKKAELFNPDKRWLINKLGFCLMKVGDYDQALFYYNKLLDQDPENQKVLLNIANCYLNKGDYDQALQYYYKVDFYSPGNAKVLRPIGWINFHVGNIDKARKYYGSLLEHEPKPADFVLAGHIYWISGERDHALTLYRQGYEKFKDKERFELVFFDDKETMRSYGLSDFEIDLIFESILE
jgi:tetratricopeptide (TPR) repeat protein